MSHLKNEIMKIPFTKKIFPTLLTVILIVILGFLFLRKNEKRNQNINQFNIYEVSEIQVKLPNSENTIKVTKEEDKEWYVTDGNKKYLADKRVVANYLNKLHKIKINKLITRKRRYQKKYHVNETDVIEIKLLNNNHILYHIYIGKSRQKIPVDPDNDDVMGTPFIRFANQNEIYEANGLLSMHLNRNTDD